MTRSLTLIALLSVPALLAGCQSKETTTKTDTVSAPDGSSTTATSTSTTKKTTN